VVVGKKVKRLHVRVLACLNGRLNGTDIVTQVRRSSSGDAGENAGFDTHKSIRSS